MVDWCTFFLQKIHFKSVFGCKNCDVEYTGIFSKIGHSSVDARGCDKNSSDWKDLIKHHPFDKAKVNHMGCIHHAYEIQCSIYNTILQHLIYVDSQFASAVCILSWCRRRRNHWTSYYDNRIEQYIPNYKSYSLW